MKLLNPKAKAKQSPKMIPKAKPRPKKRFFRKVRFGLRSRERPKAVVKEIEKIEKAAVGVEKPVAGKVEAPIREQEAKKHHYMKRNVNFSLFFLIIVILIALAGLTSYYRQTYTDQANVLKQKTDEFNTALKELSVKKVQLNETSVQLQVEAESKEQLSGLYSNLKGENEILDIKLKQAEDEITTRTAELVTAQQERDVYKSEAETWEDKYQDCDADLEGCQDDLDTCEAG